jgi:hypothetical protein
MPVDVVTHVVIARPRDVVSAFAADPDHVHACTRIVSHLPSSFRSSEQGASVSSKYVTELVFGAFQDSSSAGWQRFSDAIDVEIQHRHRRLKRAGLSSPAPLSRSFQRSGDRARASGCKYPGLKVERVAFLRHLLRPSPRLAGSAPADSDRLPLLSRSTRAFCHDRLRVLLQWCSQFMNLSVTAPLGRSSSRLDPWLLVCRCRAAPTRVSEAWDPRDLSHARARQSGCPI